ncbi:MAG: DNA gyrase subunit A, partial [Anaerolineae bacterium]|nr:DNA gyrase subunit A [Anaerolineae bacterium]
PAAMRYTEARLGAIAEEMLADINKGTVEFADNFDGSLQEPSVLPARLPNLLLNGSAGIAVGMATNIAPHNLGELCDAIAYLIDRYHEIDEVAVQDLMQFIQGPDFPTGGLIVGDEGIKNAYAKGKGRIVMRAVTHVEEMRGNRERIVVTELPYQVNKATLLERVAALVRDDKVSDISDLRDESDRRGMSIVIELKRGTDAQGVLNQLFKYTQLQSTFGYNCLALVDGTPRTLSLKRALQIYIEHRREVIQRRTAFDLERAQARAHILEGLIKALDAIDAVIQTIRESEDAETARTRLMECFELSEVQAQAILDMQLRRLANLERQKIQDEYLEAIQTIAYLEDLLTNPLKILYLIQQDVQELKQKYGDARRTHIVGEADASLSAHDLVPDVPVLISVTQRGYIKRTPVRAFKLNQKQKKKMVGVPGMETREEDSVRYLFAAGSRDDVLLFTNQGKVYQEKVYQIPERERAAKGIPLTNLIHLGAGERVTAVLSIADFEQDKYLTMFTVQGKVKRVPLVEFAAVRANGLIAFRLDEGDELGWVRLTNGRDELIVTTVGGKALRFSEDQVRPQGRDAAGMLGINLSEGNGVAAADTVAAADVIEPGGELFVATQNGFGKRTALDEYPLKGRNTGGVIALHERYYDLTGPVVAALIVQPQDRVTLITANGMALPTDVEQLPQLSRTARGEIVMNIYKGDRLAAVARIVPEADQEDEE